MAMYDPPCESRMLSVAKARLVTEYHVILQPRASPGLRAVPSSADAICQTEHAIDPRLGPSVDLNPTSRATNKRTVALQVSTDSRSEHVPVCEERTDAHL